MRQVSLTKKNILLKKVNIKNINTKYLLKSSIIFTLLIFLSVFTISNLGLVTAYATVDDLKSLKLKNPNLFNRFKDALEFYKESSDILDVKNNTELFVKIIQEYLNSFEIHQIVQALKGLKINDVIDMISDI